MACEPLGVALKILQTGEDEASEQETYIYIYARMNFGIYYIMRSRTSEHTHKCEHEFRNIHINMQA